MRQPYRSPEKTPRGKPTPPSWWQRIKQAFGFQKERKEESTPEAPPTSEQIHERLKQYHNALAERYPNALTQLEGTQILQLRINQNTTLSLEKREKTDPSGTNVPIIKATIQLADEPPNGQEEIETISITSSPYAVTVNSSLTKNGKVLQLKDEKVYKWNGKERHNPYMHVLYPEERLRRSLGILRTIVHEALAHPENVSVLLPAKGESESGSKPRIPPSILGLYALEVAEAQTNQNLASKLSLDNIPEVIRTSYGFRLIHTYTDGEGREWIVTVDLAHDGTIKRAASKHINADTREQRRSSNIPKDRLPQLAKYYTELLVDSMGKLSELKKPASATRLPTAA